MDRRAFLILSAAGLLQPDAAASPPGSPDTPGGPDPQTAAFQAWLRDFTIRAIAAGWDGQLVTEQLAGLTVNPKVVELDTKQPEFVKSTGDYVRQSVTEARVEAGRRKRADVPQFPDIVARYGVPSEILTAIWSQESAFGTIQGDLDVIRSLASLAFDGRRRDWAETQILSAFRMIQEGDATRAQMRGSWAGAMGQTQLIPEAFLTVAVDGDGDGKRDIWNDWADILGSIANYFKKSGWQTGEPVADPATRSVDWKGPEPSNALELAETVGSLEKQGYVFSTSEPTDAPAAAFALEASASSSEFWIGYHNFKVITRYNRSPKYALAAHQLGQAIRSSYAATASPNARDTAVVSVEPVHAALSARSTPP